MVPMAQVCPLMASCKTDVALTTHLRFAMHAAAGEDYPCGGRLLLFEVIRAEGSGSATAAGASWAGRLIYTRHACLASLLS